MLNLELCRFKFDLATLTPGSIDLQETSWEVSEWPRCAGVYSVRYFVFLHWIDLYWYDLDSSALTVMLTCPYGWSGYQMGGLDGIGMFLLFSLFGCLCSPTPPASCTPPSRIESMLLFLTLLSLFQSASPLPALSPLMFAAISSSPLLNHPKMDFWLGIAIGMFNSMYTSLFPMLTFLQRFVGL